MTRTGEYVYVHQTSIRERIEAKVGRRKIRQIGIFLMLSVVFFMMMAYLLAPVIFDQKSKKALNGVLISNKTYQGVAIKKKVPDIIPESYQEQSFLFSRDEKRMLKSYGVSRVQVGQNKQLPFLSQSQFEQIAAVYNIPVQKYVEFWSKPNRPQKQAVATIHKGINPGLHWKLIAQLNGIKNPKKELKAGMTLKIPVDPGNLEGDVNVYKVKSGDTLWDLAVQHYDNGGAKNQVP